MKVVVVYDSKYGNTRLVAEAINEGIGKNHENILLNSAEAKTFDFNDTEFLIVGSPTSGGWYTNPVKEFLESLRDPILKGKKVATFDTSTPGKGNSVVVNTLTKMFGNAAPRIARELEKKGATCIDSQMFIVLEMQGPLKEGELERARNWAENLLL
ncbi:MAG: flavodoxin family protein [Prolixibacteraceae bacterium]|nr:flavodoxin family protein [Prolixibacteraceae bacterium]